MHCDEHVQTAGNGHAYVVKGASQGSHRPYEPGFKATCAQRGVYALATFSARAMPGALCRTISAAIPEPQTRAILERESPITYAERITTPLIIFHGESDGRTGFVQGEMLFRSLKVLNRPVEYVRHPGATHEITRSGDNRQRMDQLLRTWEFFDRWIKN